MWDYPSEFASLCRLLNIENVLFQNNLEHLLSGCVDDEVLTKLSEGTAIGEDWLDQDADLALQKKLQRSYSVYLETVRSMSRSLGDFKQRLHLDAEGKVCQPYHALEGAQSFDEAIALLRSEVPKTVDRGDA